MITTILHYQMFNKYYLLVMIISIKYTNNYVIKYQQNSFSAQRYQLYEREEIEEIEDRRRRRIMRKRMMRVRLLMKMRIMKLMMKIIKRMKLKSK